MFLGPRVMGWGVAIASFNLAPSFVLVWRRLTAGFVAGGGDNDD